MLPQIDLVFIRFHPTALLITDLHDIAHDLIKFLNIVIFGVHILKHRIKECMHDIFSQLSQNLRIKLDCSEMIRLTFTEDGAGLKSATFLANF